MLENEFMKRGYLLPDGCKDLIDVLKLKQQQHRSGHTLAVKWHNQDAMALVTKWLKPSPAPLPPVKGVMLIPGQISVSQLAEMLGKKPFYIVAELIKMGVFTTAKGHVDFEASSKIVRKYGFLAKKADT